MDTAPAPAPRAPRITNACEACRAAKVKCQASTQLGICKRCLDSKRECIFKTGPRTRRPRQLKSPNPATTSTTTTTTSSSSSTTAPPRYPPPPGPSKTFTIDIPMPAEDDITDSLEALRLTHEKAIDMLVPNVSEGEEEEEEDNNYGYDDYGGDGRYGDYDQEMCDHDWLDQQEVTSTSVAGSVLSHASSLPLGASALSTPPSSVVVVGGGGGAAAAAAAAGIHQSQGLGQSQSQSLGAQGQQQGGEGPKTKSRTLASLRLQPQFNLDSAGKLLETFRKVMLSHFHCVVVGEGDTVAGMAKERPFVLLAVLAAASGSRTLQGHSLYDEEFRKILGLKFVAGGERTLELLQGLVVYIAWYPFHLRPKNKQAVQYIRMIVDIISDLELDEDPGTDSMEVPPTPQRLDEIRLYLASYYLASSFASTWGRSSSLAYTEYTARCSDLLQHHSPLQGDRVLAWQARLQRLVEETNDLRRTQRGRSQSEYQIGLMIRGMETQLAEWEARMDMDPPIAANTSIRIGVLFTRVFLSGAPLLKLPSVRRLPLPALVDESSSSSASFCADPRRLMSVIPALHALYEYLLALDPAEVNSFIGIEWGALILGIILGFRMSFPLVVCPEWDDRAAREAVGFRGYVDRFCNMGGGGLNQSSNLTPASSSGAGPRSMDVLSASKVVLDMVRRKFLKRVVKLEGAQQRQQQQQQQMEAILAAAPHPVPMPMPTAGRRAAVPHDSAISGCPMMDGSMEPYYPYWDETFNSNLAGSAFVATGAQGGVEGAIGMDSGGVGLPNDLWTAMTMGWSQGDVDFDGL